MMQKEVSESTSYTRKLKRLVVALMPVFGFLTVTAQSTRAIISESLVDFKTYAFDDPNPSPILMSDPGIYPYHRFEGYSSEGQDSAWKVVKLENEYIEVYVLPQVGGKVWGAIEKSTGEEFIYRNEVMKFRNISMRGPWTSGGIEFNFGIIGHHPSTATAVDYKLHENQDGSVSCTVGNIDLPSRTQWRVEILLAPDKAYFETRVVWYNPTSSSQSYYNWMTGAAVASDDLTFYCPGDAYLDHPGGIHDWPFDAEGRKISHYGSNDFGGSKSYHVVGVHDDFFGGYYADRDFGFGHWAPYESMPGQKLWLWALSRSGGIWEDLLTDTDGQYIEFQAGRMLNQFSPSGSNTPISKVAFDPGTTDIWRELWFPVKQIGGLTSVSTKGILHVVEGPDSLQVGLNALSTAEGPIFIYDGDELVYEGSLRMQPMDVQNVRIALPKDAYTIEVPGMDLQYVSDRDQELNRPYESDPGFIQGRREASADLLYRQAQQQLRMRKYKQAVTGITKCLETDPYHLQGLTLYADLLYRSADYLQAKEVVEKALSLDTYAPESNFVAGKIYRQLGQEVDALEAYGWAARSMEYRSSGYALMAEIYLKKGEIQDAVNYARNAIDYNRFHVGARNVLTIAARMVGNVAAADRQIQTLLAIDPLNHFGIMEQYLLGKAPEDSLAVLAAHRSEMPYQTFLELALTYHKVGRDKDALKVLQMAPSHPMIVLWKAFLLRGQSVSASNRHLQDVQNMDAAFVFPYRPESLHVLVWANEQADHWKLKYYLALIHWGLGHEEQAGTLMSSINEDADLPSFYTSRAHLMEADEMYALKDVQHALEMDKSSWRSWMSLIDLHDRQEQVESMLTASREAFERLPNNYTIGMAHAKALIYNDHFEEAIDVLDGLNVLPFEGARSGRSLWEQAHIGAALDLVRDGHVAQALPTLLEGKEWPERLGVGKPYNPDELLANYLLAYCYDQQGEKSKKRAIQKEIQGSVSEKDDPKPLLAAKFTKWLEQKSSGAGLEELTRDAGPWSTALLDGNSGEIESYEATFPGIAVDTNYRLMKRSLLLDW